MDQSAQDAKALKRLIEEKDYAGLESYLVEKKPDGTNPTFVSWDNKLGWCREIILIEVATKLRDTKAIELLIRHNADNFAEKRFSTFTSEDRLFLAPFYNEENDPQNYKKGFLAHLGVQSGSLAEIKYWHEERGLFLTLSNMHNFFCAHGSPLAYSSFAGYNDCVEYLVKKVGYDVKQEIAYYGNFSTPLKAALLGSQISTAELLVQLGADPHMEISDKFWHQTHNNTIIKRSLVHHLCQIHNVAVADQEIANRVEGMKWALNKGIDYDKNTIITDDYNDNNLDRAPALVLACRIKAPELVKILIENQPEKWINHGGPLLEAIAAIPNYNNVGLDRLVPLVELILPLVNPDARDEHLANALACATLNSYGVYEEYLKNSLGADLKHVTKKEKYNSRHSSVFATRMKLARDGVEFLIEQNETDQYMIARVDIPTNTAMIESIRKKMKNIQEGSEIFFELGAENTDPEYVSTWHKIKHRPIDIVREPSRILLLDKQNNKIYYGVPEIEDLVLDKKMCLGRMINAFASVPAFRSRFSVFAETTPTDERSLVLPKGYRIMFKPVSFSPVQNNIPTAVPTENNNNRVVQGNDDNAEDEISEEQTEGGRPRRRAARVAKRKLEQADSSEDKAAKRRKTRK